MRGKEPKMEKWKGGVRGGEEKKGVEVEEGYEGRKAEDR